MVRMVFITVLVSCLWGCVEAPVVSSATDEMAGAMLPDVPMATAPAATGGAMAPGAPGAPGGDMGMAPDGEPPAGMGMDTPAAPDTPMGMAGANMGMEEPLACRPEGESCNTSDQCCDQGECVNFMCQGAGVAEDPPSGGEQAPDPPVETGPVDPTTLSQCVDQMIGLFETIYDQADCNNYDVEEQRMDQLMTSSYWRQDVAASCMLFECEGCDGLMGTSGFPAARSCSDLDDQVTILRSALMTAVDECECTAPVFQVRVMSLNDFEGGEPCNQMICRLGAGESVMVSE